MLRGSYDSMTADVLYGYCDCNHAILVQSWFWFLCRACIRKVRLRFHVTHCIQLMSAHVTSAHDNPHSEFGDDKVMSGGSGADQAGGCTQRAQRHADLCSCLLHIKQGLFCPDHLG